MADDGEEPKSMTVKERLALMKKQAEDAKAAKEAASVPSPRPNSVRKWSVPVQNSSPTLPKDTLTPSTAVHGGDQERISSIATSTPPPSSVFEKDTGDSSLTSSVSKLAAGLSSGIKFGAPPAGFRLPGMGNASPPADMNADFSSSPPSSSSSTTEASPGEMTHVNLTRAKLTTPRKRCTSTKLKLGDLESAGVVATAPDDPNGASADNS